MSTGLYLTREGPHRCLSGHPWIYEWEIAKIRGTPEPGALVSLRDPEGRFLGSAIFNPKSKMCARLISREKMELDAAWIQARIASAWTRRRGAETCRVVWSEADGMPGLIVDRYGSCAVFQILHVAWEIRREAVVQAILDTLPVETVIERSDVAARDFEGLPRRSEVCRGSYTPPSRHKIGAAVFELNLLEGQKTGAYLDQAENYQKVAAYAQGRRVLDCFSNAGGFAIHCALAGATSVTAVDVSASVIAEGINNSALNGVNIAWEEANVFDYLRKAVKDQSSYNLIILDPPSFTKSRSKVAEALRGYREIHVRAFQLLAPGGIVATYSCSHHVPMDLLEEAARGAAGDARRVARVIARQTQAEDHPVLLAMPESEYLKGMVLEVE